MINEFGRIVKQDITICRVLAQHMSGGTIGSHFKLQLYSWSTEYEGLMVTAL
jgi:hypothetical protein